MIRVRQLGYFGLGGDMKKKEQWVLREPIFYDTEMPEVKRKSVLKHPLQLYIVHFINKGLVR